jgi:Ras-related GTP-binding protein C/D
MEKAFLFDVVSKIYVATDNSPVLMETYELCSDMIDVVIDVSGIYGYTIHSLIRARVVINKLPHASIGHNSVKGKGDALAYDAESASVIKLSNNFVLYLREVNKYLALVCLMRADSFTKAGSFLHSHTRLSYHIVSCFVHRLTLCHVQHGNRFGRI